VRTLIHSSKTLLTLAAGSIIQVVFESTLSSNKSYAQCREIKIERNTSENKIK
jgi:hypothetical protein